MHTGYWWMLHRRTGYLLLALFFQILSSLNEVLFCILCTGPSELGIEINFNIQRIIWEGIGIPMKDKHIISDLQNATSIYYRSIKPTVLKEARQTRILDADYSALDLDDYAHLETHLSKEQQEKLSCSLRKYPKLFCAAWEYSRYLQRTSNYVL
jgi:hypothetical protein